MSIESILTDLTRAGQLTKDESVASKNCQAALNLLLSKQVQDKQQHHQQQTAQQQPKGETDPETVFLLVALFVEATRQRISNEDFTSTCTDYLTKSSAAVVKKVVSSFIENREILTTLHSTFFVDLPHIVGISSSIQHHVRDFALTGSTNNNNNNKNKKATTTANADEGDDENKIVVGVLQPGVDEKPRSVANFVFSLDLATRGIINNNNANANSKSGDTSSNNKNKILFQCTAEQALEFASSLRAAANALQRVEDRSKQ